jgi:hypothetical protein
MGKLLGNKILTTGIVCAITSARATAKMAVSEQSDNPKPLFPFELLARANLLRVHSIADFHGQFLVWVKKVVRPKSTAVTMAVL